MDLLNEAFQHIGCAEPLAVLLRKRQHCGRVVEAVRGRFLLQLLSATIKAFSRLLLGGGLQDLPQTVNSSSQLLCCFDVSKASLSLYAEYQSEEKVDTCRIEEEIPNQTGAVERLLTRLHGLAEEAGLNGLHVLAEAAGGYERKLLQTARRLGHETGLINPEHVAKLKTVESNDTGKTDHKDPRVMHLIARLGKTQTDRHLPKRYRKL